MTSPEDPPRVSPAARSLYTELYEAKIVHRLALAKRRLLPILHELVRANAAVVLPEGHVLDGAYYSSLRERITARCPCSSLDVASECGLTHGQARAILDAMVRDGALSRRDRVWSVATDQ